MAFITPTVAEFKAYFYRDFPYAGADEQTNFEKIVDADITKAIGQATASFNSALGYGDEGTPAPVMIAFLLLAAHFLVIDIRMSSKGLDSTGEFAISSKSAGNVSVSYQLPDAYAKNVTFQGFAQTQYGQKYLQLSIPLLAGAGARVVWGTTGPYGYAGS